MYNSSTKFSFRLSSSLHLPLWFLPSHYARAGGGNNELQQSYLACLVFLKMHPDWATGIMFSRYFMPFMGGRRKQEAPIQENSTITTSKRVVIESMIYMQCFSEDGMTVVNALLNGKKFTSSNAFAYGLTAVFTLDTISELAYFCM
mmetsp:Transcript_10404/g.16674  ORF Transcript_10404/g.16674 Transcript_10404/m.16674 type:complete len:146 (-) Transcript_10404:601-1038(-)